MDNPFPKVGIGVMLLKENKILLGKRNDNPEKASSELKGEGTWTMPGGKIHFGEKWQDAAEREVKEETGIVINKERLSIIRVNNDIIPNKHFVTICIQSKDFQGEAQVLEPEEITEWGWFELSNLPSNIYVPSKKAIDEFLKSQN